MIVIRNLAHVIVEVPAARVLSIGDAPQRILHHYAFRVTGSGTMVTKDSHGHIAGIAVQERKPERFIMLRVPRRRRRQLAELTSRHGQAHTIPADPAKAQAAAGHYDQSA